MRERFRRHVVQEGWSLRPWHVPEREQIGPGRGVLPAMFPSGNTVAQKRLRPAKCARGVTLGFGKVWVSGGYIKQVNPIRPAVRSNEADRAVEGPMSVVRGVSAEKMIDCSEESPCQCSLSIAPRP